MHSGIPVIIDTADLFTGSRQSVKQLYKQRDSKQKHTRCSNHKVIESFYLVNL